MEPQTDILQTLESLQSTIDGISMSILLGILGIAITIFTVIYSFMESAKQRKRALGDKIALLAAPDPVLQSDLHFTVNHLKRLKRTNMAIILVVILDILITGCYVSHIILKNCEPLWIISLLLESFFVVGCLIILVVYFHQYHNRFRNV